MVGQHVPVISHAPKPAIHKIAQVQIQCDPVMWCEAVMWCESVRWCDLMVVV